MPSSFRQFRRPIVRPRTLLCICVSMLVIAVLECAVFNLPFWTTLAASTDTSAAENTLGPGLERTADGMLKVTDPTRAWLEVKADGTSAYARVDLVDATGDSDDTDDAAAGTADADATDSSDADGQEPLSTFHLRLDDSGRTGYAQAVSTASPRSRFVRTDAASTIRVWVEEQKGALVPIAAVRANVRVPFQWDWLRVAVLAFVVLLVMLWRPGSRLWRTRLDPSDPRQRRALALTLAVPAAMTLWAVAWQIAHAAPLTFHEVGGYTYDFDQYARTADALLHGHAWLDLPVPQTLAEAENPYDIVTRSRLLADGVTPIYWDHAFYDGRWYSYFGVLPAVLLFMPYQAVTSLWVDGGLNLPTGAADLLLMFGFLVFACLLIVRLLARIAPRTSVASASMIIVFFLLATNASYLWFRTNFYSVPIAASLMLTCMGLWLWLGAIQPAHRIVGDGRPDGGVTVVADWTVADGAPLSLPHLAGGAVCIAANFGCRPTFALSALLAFPLFWPQIRGIVRGLASHRVRPSRAMRAPLAIVVPALIVVAPLMAYNTARFGGPLDFGSDYQMTVTDMTNYSLPAVDLPYMIFYYLLLPLRFSQSFPYLSISPTPLPQWGFTEPMVGGFFVLCPLALLAFLLPRARRRVPRPYRAVMTVALTLALVMVVVDVLAGGLGWRYMADFGWLFALPAMPAMLRLMEGADVFEPLEDDADDTDDPKYRRVPLRRRAVRLLMMLVMLACLAVMIASCFVPGRDDSLTANNPGLFYEVRCWFTLLNFS
ncbi:hypothetical protein JS533_001460 [Bifidobacterium amazonense]|uniref:Glycosyltransferase n=1 Tax=Bifidobacterium amazonense TaxID=2809027 RepID=A0ABS9VSM0_9BIFI|nr:hypothetical protein [Bifidobacterium amazonense]MCH9274956.1 hypothetical protein [Bifidobacterium amazonense]